MKRFCILLFACALFLTSCTVFADIFATYYDQDGTARAYFTGTEVTNVDSNVDFNWGGGSPITGIGSNDFSVIWEGEFEVPVSGDYVFWTRSDDGVRLIVSGSTIIDNWTDHGPTYDSATVTGLVTGVRYTIEMQYYERSGGTRAQLFWTQPGGSRTIIPSGNLFLNSTAPSVVSASAPCDSGEISLKFSEPITQASAENLANYSATNGVVLTAATLESSNDLVTISYMGGNGSDFDLSVSNISDTFSNVMATTELITVSTAGTGLVGNYFDQDGTSGAYFTGTQTDRADATIDFDWGAGSPMSGIGSDDFSVRWQGEIQVPSDGNYIFYTLSDDGVRLTFDGNLLIDNWTNHAQTTNTSSAQALVQGVSYPFEMEYYERSGYAVAGLDWSGPGISRETIPETQFVAGCSSFDGAVVAEWRLDERNWSGSANEVLDESGNGLHGQAVNLDALPATDSAAPAISGDPGTCNYGDFDGQSDGYVQIDDPGTNSVLDLDSEYSISAWIYPRSLPGTGALQTIISKDENYEFHLNEFGHIFWWWGDDARSFETTSSVTLNQWNHIAVTYTNGRQVIYINGETAGTLTNTTAVTVNNDPVLIGSDLAIFTRRFDGYIDEVRVYGAYLSSTNVNTVMNETHACPVPSVDHFSIAHAGSGLTCEAESVTITAHDSDDLAVDVGGYTVQVSANSASTGWNVSDLSWAVGSGAGGLVETSPGVVEYTFASSESSVVLSMANISEADLDIDVVDVLDSGLTDADGPTEDPSITFVDTGLRFYNDADGDGNADGTDPISGPFVAGTASTPFVLKAVETNTETGQCQARLLAPQDVELAYECIDPISCIRDQDLQINGEAIQENAVSNVIDYNTLALTFDTEAEVPMTLSYFDVGRIRLYARATLPASGSDPAITLTGASEQFVVMPADIAVTSVTASDGGGNPGTTASGSGFVPSGTPFSVEVEVRNSNGGVTPNFGNELIPEGLSLRLENLVLPSGGQSPSLNSPSTFSVGSTAGVFNNSLVSWSEAGTITVRTSIADGSYLGVGDVTGSESGNIGRFYPAYIQLESDTVTPGCVTGDFSYMSDQVPSYLPMGVAITASAQGDGTGKLLNYDQALGYPVVSSFQVFAENNNDGLNRSSRASIPSGSWSLGDFKVNGSGAFLRLLNGANEEPDGPFNALQFGVTFSAGLDAENFSASALNMNADTADDCVAGSTCTAVSIGIEQVLRFGRLFGQNAHGSEAMALSVPLRVEYWNGTSFVENTDDSCSRFLAADTLFDSAALDTDANRIVSVGGGTSTGSFTSHTVGVDWGVSEGDAGLIFTGPGAGNTGSFFVDVDLANVPWLRSDWDQNGDSANDTSLPSIEVNFGSYRGHDRVIYWQEVLE